MQQVNKRRTVTLLHFADTTGSSDVFFESLEGSPVATVSETASESTTGFLSSINDVLTGGYDAE